MAKAKKLNSMRLLDAREIAYRAHQYDPALRDAREVAAAVGFPAEAVFKTLVAQAVGAKKPVLVMLPANTTLNLKRLAAAVGAKKAVLVAHAEAEKLTGLQVGGISALALTHKRWDSLLDARGAAQSHIVISAGKRGTQLRVETNGLLRLLDCRVVDVADMLED
ncbi:MAG: aminoacyl-tRNA deacylase [Chloroflexi bacterium]|nr:aminoacyl-tRNA deacylase [Chloroflexota bacterium]